MSKPALGRGLGSLLGRGTDVRPTGANGSGIPAVESRPPATLETAKPAGMSLLLRGRESAPGGIGDAGRATVVPPWIAPTLYASDAVMLLVAVLWTFLGSGSWRWAGIALLLGVGCVQAWVATILSGDRANVPFAPDSTTAGSAPSEPVPERKAHIRVHFVDETPRTRR